MFPERSRGGDPLGKIDLSIVLVAGDHPSTTLVRAGKLLWDMYEIHETLQSEMQWLSLPHSASRWMGPILNTIDYSGTTYLLRQFTYKCLFRRQDKTFVTLSLVPQIRQDRFQHDYRGRRGRLHSTCAIQKASQSDRSHKQQALVLRLPSRR